MLRKAGASKESVAKAIEQERGGQKVEDPKGDRVVVTYNGKFLPCKKW